MFEKLVAIEPVSLIPSAEEELHRYAKEVVLYRDVPTSDAEMVRRIGDADAVLLSYTSRMGKEVIAQCPNIRYIGMCCSLYSEESANVDIAYARTRGIQVLGIRDYGDRGVVEYVLHELTGLLHGFGMPMLRDEPVEITGLKVGIVGLGVSGQMIADALQFMGAEISYFARSVKPDAEAAGMTFKPLPQLLADSEVVFTCLNTCTTAFISSFSVRAFCTRLHHAPDCSECDPIPCDPAPAASLKFPSAVSCASVFSGGDASPFFGASSLY